MVGVLRLSRWILLAAAFAAGPAVASNYSPSDLSKWMAMGEYGDEPLCALYSTAVHDTIAQEFPDMINISLVWKPSKGLVMKLNGRFSKNPALRVEIVDTQEAWDATLAPPDGGMAARRVVVETSRLEALISNVGLGHPLAITVTESGKDSIRHETSAIYARISVPMYRACVQSLKAEAPPYKERPRERYWQQAADGVCGFRQIFGVTEYPAQITLLVDDRGAEIAVGRSTLTGGPHSGFKQRKKPDRVDIRQLYGETIEVLEEARYSITPAQLEELAADLSHGATRIATLTEPDGARTTLTFGGPLGRMSAAMFAACRKATFPSAVQ